MPMNTSANASSDDVQFLYERRSVSPVPFISAHIMGTECCLRCRGSLPCQVCDLELFTLTEEQRIEHYDNHLSKQAQGKDTSLVFLRAPESE